MSCDLILYEWYSLRPSASYYDSIMHKWSNISSLFMFLYTFFYLKKNNSNSNNTYIMSNININIYI